MNEKNFNNKVLEFSTSTLNFYFETIYPQKQNPLPNGIYFYIKGNITHARVDAVFFLKKSDILGQNSMFSSSFSPIFLNEVTP